MIDYVKRDAGREFQPNQPVSAERVPAACPFEADVELQEQVG